MSLELSNRPSALPASHRSPLLSQRARRLLKLLALYGLLIGLAIVFILPFLWMVATSLKKSQDVFTYPPTFLPSEWHPENWVEAWNVEIAGAGANVFARWLFNSAWLAIVSSACASLAGSPACWPCWASYHARRAAWRSA